MGSELSPRQLVQDHFSSSRAGTSIHLQLSIKELFREQTVVVTTDGNFDPVRFATLDRDNIIFKEVENAVELERVMYRPAARRREGAGSLQHNIWFATYHIEWKQKPLKAIKVKWAEGPTEITQWHLIGETHATAHDLIQSCVETLTKPEQTVLVFNQGFWLPDRGLWESVQQSSWDDVILDEGQKKRIIHDYRSFFDSEAMYKKYKPPGNGKTASIKAMIKDIKVQSLYVKTFHTQQGDEVGIRSIFARARMEAPCLLIFEDLDSLITNENRSFFLNEVDGLEDNDGLLLIGTTNHFERLDPALSNRPSRFDRKYTFDLPTEEERYQYALYWHGKLAHTPETRFSVDVARVVANESASFSFAYLKEAFISTLLEVASRSSLEQQSDISTILLEQVTTLRKQIEAGDTDSGLAASWMRSDGNRQSKAPIIRTRPLHIERIMPAQVAQLQP